VQGACHKRLHSFSRSAGSLWINDTMFLTSQKKARFCSHRRSTRGDGEKYRFAQSRTRVGDGEMWFVT